MSLSKDKKLVEVYRAASEAEAQIIKGLLESRGIPCLMKSNAAPSVHVFAVDGMGEVKIMVWRELAEEARGLIGRKDNV
ncbi:MAG TPA: DUF2007 domain-containing protein [Dehalococcoidales bacterium]|nr:DUF2007 domain-containing protein [Dehalococcoidales bacterium]